MFRGRRGGFSPCLRWFWTMVTRKSSSSSRISTAQKIMFVITIVCVFLLIYTAISVTFGDYYSYLSSTRRGPPPRVDFVCRRNHVDFEFEEKLDEPFFSDQTAELRTEDKVLFLVETQYSTLGQQLINVMNAMKFQYKSQVMGKSLPALTTAGAKGRYAVVVFENMYRYLNMDQWNRQILDKYCKDYGAGIVAFMPNRQDLKFDRAKVRGFPLNIYQNLRVENLTFSTNRAIQSIDAVDNESDTEAIDRDLNSTSKRSSMDSQTSASFPFFYLTKGGGGGPIENEFVNTASTDWVGFEIQRHRTYKSILWADARRRPSSKSSKLGRAVKKSPDGDRTIDQSQNTDADQQIDRSPAINVSLVVLDTGKWDGVRRVFFGNDFNSFWPMKLLFMDAVRYLSNGRLTLSLTRYLQIDIDDIFVGERGYKMNVDDVQALSDTQTRIRSSVPGFTFNLGFSGKFFRRGNRREIEGDNALIESASKFWWFPHQWRHTKPHKWNATQLETFMLLNKKFAQEYKIPVEWSYAVSPHHSGVYPVHEALYEVWKKVWNVRVTSTEEYPHLKPASLRRGFIHKEIMVLPRQTCGLYTHTVFMDSFPGGRARLDQSIKGGDLFYTFVFNPFLIFMTHQTNYANDRLASYTFESVVRFVECWTNLRLKSITPLQMAEKYFRYYPDERDAIWGNPCADKRHMAIWSGEKSCEQLPKALILGPQKTGTTALYTFLKVHPHVRSNTNSVKTFEEIQFFNGKSYRNGLDWYMSHFSSPENTTNGGTYYFEKSATYFDSELAPRRVQALLPKAKLMTILISPARRAYSWYQHMRAHGDKTAVNHQFVDVIKANEDAPRDVWQLRQHCLHPGHYAQHIERWVAHFPPKQLLLIDGDRLKVDPSAVMNTVQDFLELNERIAYESVLKFSHKKGFYCVASSNSTSTQCLGRGKGRQYDPMPEESRRYLLNYYRPHNIALHRLLSKLGYSTPRWLQQELEETL